MPQLTSDAASAYIELSLAVFEDGVLPLTLLKARMRFVQQHSDPSSPQYSIASDYVDDAPAEDWPDEGEKQHSGSAQGDEGGVFTIVVSEDVLELPMLRFSPPGNTGLSKWRFNQYDPDYFPSIPHGHHAKEKLDAYLGHILLGSKQIGREPRSSIVALWNLAKFRTFALAAIVWYRGAFPNYQLPSGRSWRLPRRRRWP